MQRLINRLRHREEPPIDRLLVPVQRFIHEEAAGGILLLIAAVSALVLANSPLDHAFEEIWETHLAFGFHDFLLDKTLHFWINDALMAVFFFVVGLEIKRSLLLGELASVRRATLPIVAALGGMILPAAFYLLLNSDGEAARGWGIPMSTDIAFSLGVLALLGTRAPLSLKVFLTAFAIVDDIGAITVIAIFFTESINWVNLGVGVGLLFLLVALNVSGVRNTLVYFLVSVVIWVSFFESGIHATVSGVLIAMTIPMRVRIDPEQFVARGRTLMDLFEREGSGGARRGTYALTTETQRGVLEELEDASKEVESPLQRLEHVLHPWVAFAIMPVFALSNAGVSLGEGAAGALASPVTVGIIVGLVIGKPIGIILFAWIAVKTGIASLPSDISWVQIAGAALLGGVGFTMAIFVTGLAFTDEALVLQSKLAILIASLAAGALGYLLIRYSRDIESRLE